MEIYLDNAATSHPKPPEVLRAVHEALTELNGNPGRSGHARALRAAQTVMNTREAVASLINAPQPENIVFCFNCTDALNLAIKGSLKVGDHVVASSLEHNSVLRVLEALRVRGLIETTLIDPSPDGRVLPESFISALRPRTALCILTHVSNVTGVIQPAALIGTIMKSRGIRFLIDGAQAVGHIPVDVQALQCDLYAFPGHKGLLGPQGTGGLYVASGLPLKPYREGGTGSSSDSLIQPSERPDCFESGTLNLAGLSGLLAGVQFAGSHRSEFFYREHQLANMLCEGLSSMPGVTLYTPGNSASCVGTVSFNVSDFSSADTADRLAEAGFAVRGGLHCAPYAHRWLGTLRRGAVRASLGWQNTESDILSLLRTVRSML